MGAGWSRDICRKKDEVKPPSMSFLFSYACVRFLALLVLHLPLRCLRILWNEKTLWALLPSNVFKCYNVKLPVSICLQVHLIWHTQPGTVGVTKWEIMWKVSSGLTGLVFITSLYDTFISIQNFGLIYTERKRLMEPVVGTVRSFRPSFCMSQESLCRTIQNSATDNCGGSRESTFQSFVKIAEDSTWAFKNGGKFRNLCKMVRNYIYRFPIQGIRTNKKIY